MSQLIIGNISFKVIKQEGNKVLLEWCEQGVCKQRWINLRSIK